jgi:diadenosine tetraphosphate (Ap4A) HIT family hydrolase/5-methylcytosine-specific restriction endonuclease McrA
MSHVYQPVMLAELLKSHGKATVRQIARAILEKDPTQVEYYENITKNMVGQVLTKRRHITSKTGDTYTLDGFEQLTTEEIHELFDLCRQKIKEYEQVRGEAIWEHRKRLGRIVSGTDRYEVLKQAKFRCVLCGVSAEEKALEVDHIIPQNLGGGSDRNNLQALCYTCNSSKRDKDSTDLRGVAVSYKTRHKGCLFCELDKPNVEAQNELAVVVRDQFPVTPLHTLIIPKRHVADYFGLYQPEINAINQLLGEQRALIAKTDPTITGFNIGVNCGESAGQTIYHCHVHLIPRRDGDVPKPRGGVRHVIPGKGDY